MPDLIPFSPGDNNYRMQVALDGTTYLFDVRWNTRNNGWYFDLREQDETPVMLGIKVVLGVNLGHTSTHSFFTKHALRAVDTTGAGRDAAYDDLGSRVVVLHMTADEVVNPTTSG